MKLTLENPPTHTSFTQVTPSTFCELQGFDYLELYVGNVHQAARYYCSVFGFTPIAHLGPQTGVRDRVSCILKQGDIHLVLTGALNATSPIAEHIRRHSDSVKDMAFRVEHVQQIFEQALSLGAEPIMEPTTFDSPDGAIIKATIAVFGDTVHSFIQRGGSPAGFLPGYQAIHKPPIFQATGLLEIDHIALCVEAGKLDHWVDFYSRVFGFRLTHEENAGTEYSAMNSKVVQNASGTIKFPMLEPATGKRKSQIDEYLAAHEGPGVQHLAFLAEDILQTVATLRSKGIEFLGIPQTYYDVLEARVGPLDPAWLAGVREQEVLMDRDEWGILLQAFSKPLQDRPTLFLELVQRRGALGFGSNNIRALFEAVEREQALRQNL